MRISATSTSSRKGREEDKNPDTGENGGMRDSLQQLVAESFDTLEVNINDIIAFEEAAEKKQDDFDRARKMSATPSERYIMPSPAVPQSKKTSAPPPTKPPKKRISLSSDSSWMKSSKNSDGNDDDGDGDQIMTPSAIRKKNAAMKKQQASPVEPQPTTTKEERNENHQKATRRPSDMALSELKEISNKFEGDMKIDELRLELEKVTQQYEIFGTKPPFGIDGSEQHNPPNGVVKAIPRRSISGGMARRVSFQKELPSLDEHDAQGAIKERLTFFKSTLQEYTTTGTTTTTTQQEQPKEKPNEKAKSPKSTTDNGEVDEEVEEAVEEEEGESHSSSDEITHVYTTSNASVTSSHAERRLSDVTLDTTFTDRAKRATQAVVEEGGHESDDERLRTTKTQSTPEPKPDKRADTETKARKFGERMSKLFKLFKTWLEKQVAAFVASFTPKEQMIVKQMG